MTEPQSKKFSLKNTEQAMLQVIQQQTNILMANYTSNVAYERLAYPVTPHTRFEFAPDFSEVTISEVTPEADTGVIETVEDKK